LWRKWLRKCNNPIREANKRKEPKEREIELPVGYSQTHANKRSMKLWKATNIWSFLEDPPLYKSCNTIYSHISSSLANKRGVVILSNPSKNLYEERAFQYVIFL
jgi:hypothetical protein